MPYGPPPAQYVPAPSGYWVYQPANGFGVSKVVPVYGPQGDQPPGVGQPLYGGQGVPGPMNQPGGYPVNVAADRPAMAPNNVPGGAPYAGGAPVPPSWGPQQTPYPQGYNNNPGTNYPQGAIGPSYAPAGYAGGAATGGGTPAAFSPGTTAAPNSMPQFYGGQNQATPNFAPQASAPSAAQR